jgi:hypothetical protein
LGAASEPLPPHTSYAWHKEGNESPLCRWNEHQLIEGSAGAMGREAVHELGILKRLFVFQEAVGLF